MSLAVLICQRVAVSVGLCAGATVITHVQQGLAVRFQRSISENQIKHTHRDTEKQARASENRLRSAAPSSYFLSTLRVSEPNNVPHLLDCVVKVKLLKKSKRKKKSERKERAVSLIN